MSDAYAQGFKVFIYKLSNLPTGALGGAIIHCSDENELKVALTKYRSSKKVVVCAFNELIGLDTLLLRYPIDTLFVLNNDQDNEFEEWFDALIVNDKTELPTQRQLMRSLCLMIVRCYYNQSKEYRKKENEAMANLCIQDSLKVLDYSIQFI